MKKSLWIGLGAALMMVLALPKSAIGGDVEREYRSSQQRLTAFDQGLTLQERKALKQGQNHSRLTGALLEKYKARESLKNEVEELRWMMDLKNALLLLPGVDSPQREREAEAVARVVVPAFGELRRDYSMVRPALFHNLLVNVGLKEQGLCWQWARDLTDRLRKLDLKTFDLLWATARGGTMREHNTVVLVSHGHPLEDGLVLDGWKLSGKPFWIRVTDDKKHPWKVGEYYGGS